MFSPLLLKRVADIIQQMQTKQQKLVTVESCTGGLMAALFTEIPGASAVFERGLVTYSNQAKTEMVGISAALIMQRGAVSAEVAVAMAEGGLRHSQADIAIAVTGIAGPEGGTDAKPVGTVYIAVAGNHTEAQATHYLFSGDRGDIRLQTVEAALNLLARQISA